MWGGMKPTPMPNLSIREVARIKARCRPDNVRMACIVGILPAIDRGPGHVGRKPRFLIREDDADAWVAAGWGARMDAYTLIRYYGRELLPEIEREEIESLRSILRATADKLHAVAIARRSKIIQKCWAKRSLDVSDDETRKNIRVILASIDFTSPEQEDWESGKATLVKVHGQTIFDAADVQWVDPDIHEQVAREATGGPSDSRHAAGAC